ncbi:hypothetical protein LCGC14_3167800 [marine sediment metagenome]|uniref:Uncharacterized protein n=1 Tax=marine sediment metagenome TaxID=412755 RepID=A0A0F8VHK4_9ZZZZ
MKRKCPHIYSWKPFIPENRADKEKVWLCSACWTVVRVEMQSEPVVIPATTRLKKQYNL